MQIYDHFAEFKTLPATTLLGPIDRIIHKILPTAFVQTPMILAKITVLPSTESNYFWFPRLKFPCS
jgi:hypothetical protein